MNATQDWTIVLMAIAYLGASFITMFLAFWRRP